MHPVYFNNPEGELKDLDPNLRMAHVFHWDRERNLLQQIGRHSDVDEKCPTMDLQNGQQKDWKITDLSF
jgi:hypothetical protein